MTFGQRVKARREELNMTQGELATRLEYKSKSSVNKIETGNNNLPLPKVIRLAAALETTPSYLMGWTAENPDETQISDGADGVASYVQQPWYTDPDAAELAQRLFDDPAYRVLFDAAADATPEDLQAAADILRRLKEARRK